MQANGAAGAAALPGCGDSDDFFVSGYADELEALGGSAAVVDERVGERAHGARSASSRTSARSPTARSRSLRNAILGPIRPSRASRPCAPARPRAAASTSRARGRLAPCSRARGRSVAARAAAARSRRATALSRRADGGRTTRLTAREDPSAATSAWASDRRAGARRAPVRPLMTACRNDCRGPARPPDARHDALDADDRDVRPPRIASSGASAATACRRARVRVGDPSAAPHPRAGSPRAPRTAPPRACAFRRGLRRRRVLRTAVLCSAAASRTVSCVGDDAGRRPAKIAGLVPQSSSSTRPEV